MKTLVEINDRKVCCALQASKASPADLMIFQRFKDNVVSQCRDASISHIRLMALLESRQPRQVLPCTHFQAAACSVLHTDSDLTPWESGITRALCEVQSMQFVSVSFGCTDLHRACMRRLVQQSARHDCAVVQHLLSRSVCAGKGPLGAL